MKLLRPVTGKLFQYGKILINPVNVFGLFKTLVSKKKPPSLLKPIRCLAPVALPIIAAESESGR
jgi:hypothetical protein